MIINTPKFPTEEAFQFGFESYGNAYLGKDWICDGFNFAVALAHASHAMGRKYCIQEQGVHYPNFYQCILGRSHLAAKSPTLERAVAGVNYIRRNVDPPEMFRVITEINSPEGFRADFATHCEGDEDEPELWYSDGNGVRGFVPCDEFATLLSKSRQKSTEGISVELTRSYNPSDSPLENNTRKDKTFGVDWVINVFACSTLEWYERFITSGDYSSGFLNRFVFYLHEQMPIKARFDPFDGAHLGAWQNMIAGLATESLQHHNPRRYRLSDEAFEVFEGWHDKIYKYLIENVEDTKAEAGARIVSQTLKLSLVYAVLDNKDEISKQHFEAAKAVGEYWGKCAGITVEVIDFDSRSKAERKVFEAIERLTDGKEHCTRRMIRNAINKKYMSSKEMNEALDSLVNADIVCFEHDGKSTKVWIP